MGSRGTTVDRRHRVVEGRPLAERGMRNAALLRQNEEALERHVERASVPATAWETLAADRMGFGAGPRFASNWSDIPGSGETKFDNYVEQQINPNAPQGDVAPPVDDTRFDQKVAAAGFTTVDRSHTNLWQSYAIGGQNRNTPVQETEYLTWIRMVHSHRQLEEVMADFWHNHFNCYGFDHWARPMWPSWDRTLRLHSMRNFRDLLAATSKHSVMLYYLDQYTSSDDGPNENYARELIELHTLGAEHYLGVIDQGEVPIGVAGHPVGYVDNDVFDMALALTGWTVDSDTGAFYFREEWNAGHANKTVVGLSLPRFGGVGAAEMALDHLAYHPSTARHIARKLCVRLISDHPPSSIVDSAADVFYNQRFSGGQIRKTLRHILKSQEFKSSWNQKTKRPLEIAAGALRTTNADFPFSMDSGDNDDLSSFLWRYDGTGQPLFGNRTPDGFPDDRETWQSTLPRIRCWRIVNWLSNQFDGNQARIDPTTRPLPSATNATEIVEYWINRILQRDIPSEDKNTIINFLGVGNPNAQIDFGDEDDHDRARAMIALILNSPYFLER